MSLSLETNSLKLATAEDADVVMELMREFHGNTMYARVTDFEEEYVRDQFLHLIKAPVQDSCVVLMKSEDKVIGLVAMTKFTSSFDSKVEIAIEKAFWIKPEYRNFARLKLMLKAFYYWARTAGYKAALVGKLRVKNSPEYYSMRVF